MYEKLKVLDFSVNIKKEEEHHFILQRNIERDLLYEIEHKFARQHSVFFFCKSEHSSECVRFYNKNRARL